MRGLYHILLVVHHLLCSSNILKTTIIYCLASSYCSLFKRMLSLGMHQGMYTAHFAHRYLSLVRQKISCSEARQRRRCRWGKWVRCSSGWSGFAPPGALYWNRIAMVSIKIEHILIENWMVVSLDTPPHTKT